MTKYLILIFISFCGILNLNAESALSRVEGNVKSKDYVQAISVLQDEINTHGVSASAYYDLALLYHKAGNLGATSLNLHRALLLNPRLKEARNNLKYVDAEVAQINQMQCGNRNLDPTPGNASFTASMLEWLTAIGSNTFMVISIILFIITLLCGTGYLILTHVGARKFCFFGGGVTLLLSLVCLALSAIARQQILDPKQYIVMDNQIQLLSKPTEQSKAVATPLTAGSCLTLLESKKQGDTEWLKVSLNPDYTGWVKASQLESIRVKEIH